MGLLRTIAQWVFVALALPSMAFTGYSGFQYYQHEVTASHDEATCIARSMYDDAHDAEPYVRTLIARAIVNRAKSLGLTPCKVVTKGYAVKRGDDPLWTWRNTSAPSGEEKLARFLPMLAEAKRVLTSADYTPYGCVGRYSPPHITTNNRWDEQWMDEHMRRVLVAGGVKFYCPKQTAAQTKKG